MSYEKQGTGYDGASGHERQGRSATPTNATFYAFKDTPSLKWGYSGRGVVDDYAFTKIHDAGERRRYLVELNGGLHPGMNTPAHDFWIVVVPDGDAPGWPQLYKPLRES